MASLRDIIGYYRPYKAIALWSITVTCLLETIDLVVPYGIGQCLNILSHQPVDPPIQELIRQVASLTSLEPGKLLSLGVLLGLIFTVTVIKAPIQPWLGVWYHWEISLKARRDNLRKIIAKVLTLPVVFYDEHNPGRIASRISKGVENHAWTYPELAGQLIPKLVRILAIFVVILLIEWRIALLFLLSFILILTYSLKNLQSLIKQEKVLDEYMEGTQSRTSEIITNIKTVKAFATEAMELKRQNQRLEREFKVIIHRIHKGYVRLVTWQKTVIQLSIFLLLLLTLIPTVKGQISLGHFMTTLTVSSMAYSELEPISQLAEVFSRRYASISRLHDFLLLPSSQDAASLNIHDIIVNPYHFTGKIELNNLSFGYTPNRLILKNINLLIKPYQTIALVGRSGSGKSTLVKLLFRYFEPTQGQILMDGEPINTLDITHYRRRLAIVHQEVDVFNGTILDNLTYGNRNVSFAQIEQACKIARVDEFISDLPQGYYTIVGERGVRLSGGQRQRLGIARALIVNPDVLVFDEATSSLDSESEKLIQLAMRSILGTRTTLIIAHRLSTIREADKIVVLDNGKIVEVGTHQELLNHQGVYHRLHSWK